MLLLYLLQCFLSFFLLIYHIDCFVCTEPAAPKPIKYLGINLAKDMKDLYFENHTTLMKEIQDDERNGKMFYAHE